MFNINFRDIVLKNWIPFLRKQKTIDFLYSLIKPLQSLNDSFNLFRNKVSSDLSYNSQVIQLERLLNDCYDPTQRRIFIEDTANIDYNYLYNELENREAVYFYNNWDLNVRYAVNEFSVAIIGSSTIVYQSKLNNKGKIPSSNPSYWKTHKIISYYKNSSEFDNLIRYIIHIPLLITFNELELRNKVDKYNAASYKYLINTF